MDCPSSRQATNALGIFVCFPGRIGGETCAKRRFLLLLFSRAVVLLLLLLLRHITTTKYPLLDKYINATNVCFRHVSRRRRVDVVALALLSPSMPRSAPTRFPPSIDTGKASYTAEERGSDKSTNKLKSDGGEGCV